MDCSPTGSSVHGFPGKEYWSGLPFPSPGDLLNPGMESTFLMSPALAVGFFTTSATWEEIPYEPVVPLLVMCPEKTINQSETVTATKPPTPLPQCSLQRYSQ